MWSVEKKNKKVLCLYVYEWDTMYDNVKYKVKTFLSNNNFHFISLREKHLTFKSYLLISSTVMVNFQRFLLTFQAQPFYLLQLVHTIYYILYITLHYITLRGYSVMKVFMLIKNLKVNDKFSSHKIFSSNIIFP